MKQLIPIYVTLAAVLIGGLWYMNNQLNQSVAESSHQTHTQTLTLVPQENPTLYTISGVSIGGDELQPARTTDYYQRTVNPQ